MQVLFCVVYKSCLSPGWTYSSLVAQSKVVTAKELINSGIMKGMIEEPAKTTLGNSWLE
jgi:hypothetical protein